ncbi:ROK family protein [Streptomyces sp. AV19]|uniref:ROK family protein n=1 Tax=Streptomyces sp. AV19 TaxID=2793068 RepID=UPI0018FEF22E|nr:ROK family protein [Streptomyces sp. AV19]MBH1938939.1 ROK family protein [Streptomyces sp. AV19]MDG4536821.1 ROK family protein [Streptomyces sp. AV19]
MGEVVQYPQGCRPAEKGVARLRPAVWGLDIGATKVALGTLTETGVQVRATVATPPSPDGLLPWLRSQLPRRLDGLGVAFPGGMDSNDRVTSWPNRPTWDGFPLGKELCQLAEAVTIVDDGEAAALGECRRGVAFGRPDVMVVVLGTGIGGAVVVNDQLRSGLRRDPRTLGHVRILDGGGCACGATGCAQTALRSLPPDGGLGPRLSAWPDGRRLIDFVADLARLMDVQVVLTGGLMERPVLRYETVARLNAAGLVPLVPEHPGQSSLLGATVLEHAA